MSVSELRGGLLKDHAEVDVRGEHAKRGILFVRRESDGGLQVRRGDIDEAADGEVPRCDGGAEIEFRLIAPFRIEEDRAGPRQRRRAGKLLEVAERPPQRDCGRERERAHGLGHGLRGAPREEDVALHEARERRGGEVGLPVGEFPAGASRKADDEGEVRLAGDHGRGDDAQLRRESEDGDVAGDGEGIAGDRADDHASVGGRRDVELRHPQRDADLVPQRRRRHVRGAEHDRAAERGLARDVGVELLDGEIRHARSLDV